MSTKDVEGKAICILSLDSGGPGTYSQLMILKEYMSRLAGDLDVSEEEIYPADHFDLMGGVGFGGLVAILLGYLRMNVDEAIDALITVATAVFPEEAQSGNDLEKNSKNLKESIEEVLQSRNVPLNAKMHDRDRRQARCKIVLYAATSDNINLSQSFRTYLTRGSSLNPTIVEAICATMAIPSFFSPVKIGRSQRCFVGGALGANNPTREVLKEAGTVFGNEKRVAQILSIGCGIPPVLSLELMKNETVAGRLLKELPIDCQMVAKELAARLLDVDAYLRLDVEQGLGNIGMNEWSKLAEVETRTACYVETQAVMWALEASLKGSKQSDGTVTLAQLNHSSTIKIAAKTAPPVSPYFVPRTKEWEKLVWHLATSPFARQRIFPITGMGGCGKTQMISYFLQEYPSLFKRVVFVDASSLSSIKADLQAWARTLGNGHEHDVWEDAVRILTSVPKDERWGLILDNADDPTLNLSPILPKCDHLTVIISSRNRNVGNLSTTYHMELGEMEQDEALTTLLRSARRQLPLSDEELKSANTLLKELGCLAVALVQAGTYCHELSYSFTRYLALFYSHRAELMKKPEPSSLDNYQRGVYTTLDLSYKVLSQLTKEFLHLLSFFHHTDIPLAALETAAKCDFEDSPPYLPRPADHAHILAGLRRLLCIDGHWNEMQIQETFRTLRSFSLLSISSIDDSIFLRLHPLIQAWSRDMISSVSSHYRSMTSQVLTTCCRDDALLLRYLLPHALNVLDHVNWQDMHLNDLMAIGKILDASGHYRAAREVFSAALELLKKIPGPDEEVIVGVSVWLGNVYSKEGKWKDAEELFQTALNHSRRLLGVEHPDTILTAGNLATIYSNQGRWDEAAKLELEVLEQQRRILGLEHPDTITAVGNLAGTYCNQGRWDEAEKLALEVLEQRRRILGLEHPHTILAAGNLASIYQNQGRWGEAEKLGLEVLEQRRRILGLEHPDTIRAAGSLASIYGNQGRWNEAEKLGLEVLEQSRIVLGLEHPDTIQAADSLATTYHVQGRWGEAEKLELEVLEQRRRILGLEHPHTICAAGNLASIYGKQGRWKKAEELELEVLERRRRILGLEHPHTILAAGNLALTYNDRGLWDEAEKLALEVLEQRRRILGLEHPDTIRAAGRLGSIYGKQGLWEKAEKLELEVLEQRRRIMGLEHPDTILAAGNLASIYGKQGRWNEAAKLGLEVLEQRRRVLGLEHPYTVLATGNLAVLYGNWGHWDEAEKLGLEALEQRRRILGLEHPDTIRTADYLALIYRNQGRWYDAEELELDMLEQRRRILGLEHPDTIRAVANYLQRRKLQNTGQSVEFFSDDIF